MSQIITYENLTRFRKPLVKKIIKHININRNSKGLDIGCGIGQITNILSEKLEKKGSITGLYYSVDFIKYANQNFKKDNIDFIQADVNNLNLALNSYDWI